MDSEKLIENAYNIGNYLLERLKKVSQIKEARGRGLMIGIEFDFPIEELRKNYYLNITYLQGFQVRMSYACCHLFH